MLPSGSCSVPAKKKPTVSRSCVAAGWFDVSGDRVLTRPRVGPRISKLNAARLNVLESVEMGGMRPTRPCLFLASDRAITWVVKP